MNFWTATHLAVRCAWCSKTRPRVHRVLAHDRRAGTTTPRPLLEQTLYNRSSVAPDVIGGVPVKHIHSQDGRQGVLPESAASW
jgi:hypothetical protein